MATIVERTDEPVPAPTDAVPILGPRVRWGGVMSGFFIAIGALMLLTALGLAIGITALDDPRVVTGEEVSNLGIGAGIWAFISLLVAVFFGGMVSTQVTDRPDRPAAVIHGVVVWVLLMLFILWLMVSGITLGMSGLFSAMTTLARGATAAVGIGVSAGDDLAPNLGLDDPNRVLTALDDPRTVSVLATATGMSNEEARAALDDLRVRVEAAQNDPARVAAEVRNFLAQYGERARQQALETAASAQRGATIGSWVTFGVMLVSLAVAIAGAVLGVPSLQRWRQAFVRVRP